MTGWGNRGVGAGGAPSAAHPTPQGLLRPALDQSEGHDLWSTLSPLTPPPPTPAGAPSAPWCPVQVVRASNWPFPQTPSPTCITPKAYTSPNTLHPEPSPSQSQLPPTAHPVPLGPSGLSTLPHPLFPPLGVDLRPPYWDFASHSNPKLNPSTYNENTASARIRPSHSPKPPCFTLWMPSTP